MRDQSTEEEVTLRKVMGINWYPFPITILKFCMVYTSSKLPVNLFSLIIDFRFKAKIGKDPKRGSKFTAYQRLFTFLLYSCL